MSNNPVNTRSCDTDRRIGARIRAARIEAGLTQQGMANRIGVTYQQAHKYERGINRVSAAMLIKIASTLGRAASWFLSDDEPSEMTAPRATLDLVRDYQTLAEPQRAVVRDLARALATTHAG